MYSLKPLASSILSLACGVVFAGTMGEVCVPFNVTVPCEQNAWDVGITALYLKPIESANFGYRVAVREGDYTRYVDWGHDYNWGFRLEGSYHFNTGNDINLNWNHINAKTDSKFAILSQTFHHVLSSDSVNGELGQLVDFSRATQARFFGGLQYLRLFGSIDNYLTGSFLNHSDSHFNGVGPRVGADLFYGVYDGIRVYAKSATAIVYGKSEFYDGINFIIGSKDALVPELEAKLGADWTYAMAQGVVTVDAGFMWVNYFNAIHNTIGRFSGIGGFETDLSYAGPYFGLKYVGNV